VLSLLASTDSSDKALGLKGTFHLNAKQLASWAEMIILSTTDENTEVRNAAVTASKLVDTATVVSQLPMLIAWLAAHPTDHKDDADVSLAIQHTVNSMVRPSVLFVLKARLPAEDLRSNFASIQKHLETGEEERFFSGQAIWLDYKNPANASLQPIEQATEQRRQQTIEGNPPDTIKQAV